MMNIRIRWDVSLAVVALTILVAAAPSNAGFEDGLLNYWEFEGTLNDTAGTDFLGTASTVDDNGVFDGANGTAGISYGAGNFGAGLDQDGAGGAQQNNGFVRVTRSDDTLQGGADISISAWVETDGFDSSWQTILAHGEGSQYRIARRGGGNVASYAGGSGDIPGAGVGPDISAGTGWHHIVAISEHGVSTRIWVDGGLVATGGAPNINDNGNGNPNDPDLYIGGNPQTGANNREWWGHIDDVAIWDRPLTDSEVDIIYSVGQGGGSLRELLPPIPEPTSITLVIMGLLGLMGIRRRR